MPDSLTIDGFGPVPVRAVTSVADVQDAVRTAAATGTAVYPVGGRTMLDLGLPPTKPGVALDMTGLNRVIDYPARDMTVTVEAGITIAALRELLKKEGQWLPVDVPNPEKATVGGVIAANVSGPRRLGYGTIRDYLIGISFVADNGDDVKAGGRVVKNVAGYDLMKTHTGALGTLGVITRATFKVTPIPTVSAGLLIPVEPPELAATLDKLQASRSRPCAVEVYNTLAGMAGGLLESNGSLTVLAAFEGGEAAVAWQMATAKGEFPDAAELPAALLLPLPRFGGEGRGEGEYPLKTAPNPLTLTLSPEAGERGPENGTSVGGVQARSTAAVLLPLPRFGDSGGGEGVVAGGVSCSPLTLTLSPEAGERGPARGTTVGDVLESLTAMQTRRDSTLIGKASVRPSRLAALLTGLPSHTPFHAHGLTGVAWVHANDELPAGFLARRLDPAKKTALNVFGPAGSDRQLMAELKAALDPKGLFNPGRGPVG